MLYTSLNIPAQSSLFLLAALESRPFLRPKPLPPHTLAAHIPATPSGPHGGSILGRACEVEVALAQALFQVIYT